MDSLFRFVSVRPAQSSDAKTVSIQGKTPFQDSVRAKLDPKASPDAKWEYVRNAAEAYTAGPGSKVVTDIKSIALYDKYSRLRKVLSGAPIQRLDPIESVSTAAAPKDPPPWNLTQVEAAIKDVFGVASPQVEADQKYLGDRAWVWDSIVLIFLLPKLHRNPFAALTEVAQIMDIVHRAAAKDQSLDEPSVISDALHATVILPQDLLPANPNRLRPVGIADLLVVKQHINRYELGEIVNIENILLGEARKKSNKHALTNERTVVVDTTTTTETTTEMSTSERFSLKRESEHIVKEDINAKAGVNVSAKYGTAEFSANASFDYANSKTDSQKVSSEYAKDVTSRASTKVTESIRVQQTTRILETFEEDEDHSFDNTHGTKNVSGIYQWVNKVYTAQVFNYGKRLLFDIMVPEPAALLLDAANISTKTATPVEPVAFTTLPSKLGYSDTNSADYYGNFLTLYGVEGVEHPPVDNISVAKTFTLASDDKATDKGGELTIPDWFEAISVHVDGMYNYNDKDSNGLLVFVADVKYQWVQQKLDYPIPPAGTKYVSLGTKCGKNIGIAIECWNVSDYAVLVEIQCQATASALQKWQLDTHSKILQAYQQKVRDYQDALTAQRMSQAAAAGPLGSNNPDTNRITERTELKRGAIQILTQDDLLKFNAITESASPAPVPPAPPVPPQLFPRPNYPKAVQDGAYARFLEQAFEWEQMQYVFYPYYWSRKSVWYDKATRTNADPLFGEFLKAGQARVVVPVRPSMEPGVWYYLMTGKPWMGGDPPMVTDSDYLSIAEEIKEATGAPGAEVPYGPSWEVVVPTTLIKLREGDSIDKVKWNLSKPWTWTAEPEGSVPQIPRR
jgi:hypothetical protein